MTETQWLTCTSPQDLLAFLQDRTTERKLRLFACACVRRFWHLLGDERSRQAVRIAEQLAEGQVEEATRQQVWQEAWDACEDSPFDWSRGLGSTWETAHLPRVAAGTARFRVVAAEAAATLTQGDVSNVALDISARVMDYLLGATGRRQAIELLHEVFGNPCRRAVLDPNVLAWHDHTVPRLAQGIYEESAFDRLPILGDALLDAGCDNEDVLTHLRSAGPHVHGCWALDLCLDWALA